MALRDTWINTQPKDTNEFVKPAMKVRYAGRCQVRLRGGRAFYILLLGSKPVKDPFYLRERACCASAGRRCRVPRRGAGV